MKEWWIDIADKQKYSFSSADAIQPGKYVLTVFEIAVIFGIFIIQ